MKRSTTKASLFAYSGVILMVLGLYPVQETLMDRFPFLHAVWHICLFMGAALLVYGLESLRTMARRHRRMTT